MADKTLARRRGSGRRGQVGGTQPAVDGGRRPKQPDGPAAPTRRRGDEPRSQITRKANKNRVCWLFGVQINADLSRNDPRGAGSAGSTAGTAFDRGTWILFGPPFSSFFTVLTAISSARKHSMAISLWSALFLSYRGIGTFRHGRR